MVSGYRPEELLRQAAIFWPKNAETPSRPAFEALLEEMFDLGVLGRVPITGTKRFRYCLASRQVAAMLGSKDDVLQTLEEIEERDPSLSYDRTIYRRAYTPIRLSDGHADAHSAYAPLTDFQIEQLVGVDGPPVRIVCGLGALGLDKVWIGLRRIAESGLLPGTPKSRPQVSVIQAGGVKDLRDALSGTVPAQELKLVVYTPQNADEARKALDWLERRHLVLSGAVRPVLLLDAADRDMREMATRRARTPDDGVWLAAWGSEMLRIHLHNIEKTDLDSKARRAAILKATGGIPTETIQLVREVSRTEDPEGVIARWKPSLRILAEIAGGQIGCALAVIDEAKRREDYQAMDELILGEAGIDLFSIGPDLVAMGLISGWNHEAHRIRRSALGNLVAERIVIGGVT